MKLRAWSQRGLQTHDYSRQAWKVRSFLGLMRSFLLKIPGYGIPFFCEAGACGVRSCLLLFQHTVHRHKTLVIGVNAEEYAFEGIGA